MVVPVCRAKWLTWAQPPSSALLALQVDFGAVGRDRDGGVPVEVVGQVAQAGDEGLAGGGVGG